MSDSDEDDDDDELAPLPIWRSKSNVLPVNANAATKNPLSLRRKHLKAVAEKRLSLATRNVGGGNVAKSVGKNGDDEGVVNPEGVCGEDDEQQPKLPSVGDGPMLRFTTSTPPPPPRHVFTRN